MLHKLKFIKLFSFALLAIAIVSCSDDTADEQLDLQNVVEESNSEKSIYHYNGKILDEESIEAKKFKNILDTASWVITGDENDVYLFDTPDEASKFTKEQEDIIRQQKTRWLGAVIFFTAPNSGGRSLAYLNRIAENIPGSFDNQIRSFTTFSRGSNPFFLETFDLPGQKNRVEKISYSPLFENRRLDGRMSSFQFIR